MQTVMSTAAVFARMRSQQKGQVMDLLGHRGLFQHGMQQADRHLPVGLSNPCMLHSILNQQEVIKRKH